MSVGGGLIDTYFLEKKLAPVAIFCVPVTSCVRSSVAYVVYIYYCVLSDCPILSDSHYILDYVVVVYPKEER